MSEFLLKSNEMTCYDFQGCQEKLNQTLLNSPCGTFVKYDVNKPNDLTLYGFESGKYYLDQSTQYVGYGNFPDYCLAENPCPGGAQINPSPGVYITCGGTPYTDTTNGYYLVKHANLKWVDADSSNLLLVNGLLWSDGFGSRAFGRVRVNGEYSLAKVHGKSGKLYVEQGGENEGLFTSYQVLACQDPDATPDPILNSPCGTFVNYDAINNPNVLTLYGFPGGNYYEDNSIQYVGTGNIPDYCQIENPIPGGIQLTPTPGAYVTCGGMPYTDTATARFLVRNPNLKWVDASDSTLPYITNLIKSDGDGSRAFGRIFRDGAYRLAKVHLSNGNLWVEDAQGETKFTSGYQVLTC